MRSAKKDRPPTASANAAAERSAEHAIVKELRRVYAEVDERRRERERQFVRGLEHVQGYRLTRRGFRPKGERRRVDAAADMRELEADITEFCAWRERLFESRHFLAAIDAMAEADRIEGAMKLVARLWQVRAVFLAPARLSASVDPQAVAAGAREILARIAALENEAKLVTNAEANVYRERARLLRLHLETGFNPDNISRRGGRKKEGDDDTEWNESVWRGWAVREVAELVPENVEDRFAVIAGLLRCAGVEVSAPHVRSTLLKGRT